jgi:nucleoid DNA-binding protein
MSRKKPSVGRKEFIRRFMLDVGLTYEQACRAYTCAMSIIEDGVVAGEKIGLGRIGCLNPIRKPPRDIVMGFMRVGGRMVRTKRVFHVDERVEFKFRLYEEFVRKHHLKG